MRTSYKVFDPDYPYFITSTIVDWKPVFISDKYYYILIDNLNFYSSKYSIEVFAYVFLDNHFHLICRCKDLEKAIQSFKSFTAKKIINLLIEDNRIDLLNHFCENKKGYKYDSKYQVWQEGYHPKEMINEKVFYQKIEYIHNNPVRRGIVEDPAEYRYSSAKCFLDGIESEVKITRL